MLLLVAVRRRGRRPVPQAGHAPADAAAAWPRPSLTPGRHRGQRPRAGVDGLRAGLHLRHRRRPSTRRPGSRSSPRWSAPTTSPTRSGLNSAAFNVARLMGPAAAGLLIGLLGGGASASGWVILVNGSVVLRGDPAAAPDGRAAAAHAEARGPRAGDAAGGDALRPLPAQDADDPGAGLLRRHLRHELPDHLGADGDPGVRQGRGRVRHPRLRPGGRLPGAAR